MPFVGKLSGNIVYPGGVSDATNVICPKCDQEMYVRGGPDASRLRHFVHYSGNRKCSGESEKHFRWKQIVFRSFSDLELSNDESLFLCLEGEIDVSNTPSDTQVRQADVLVRFGDIRDQFGRGIAIEIQHQNTEKDRHSVTYDYLANGYSVRWVTRHDFTSNSFDAADMIAESDSTRTFFRENAITLPDYDEFCEWGFDQLSDLLDGTQARLPSFVNN